MAALTKDAVKNVLQGKVENLPPAKSNVVRIFLSSTFTDTYEERNLLITEVIPRLKVYCRESHGLEFQVVDMRWGVRDEASLDHSTSALCMREIKLCQESSIGPTFVVFLGQRYGFRPLPSIIPHSEMQAIKNVITVDENLSHLNEWYWADENAVPPEHILQRIDKDIVVEDRKEDEDDPFDYVKAFLNEESDALAKEQERIKLSRKKWAQAEKKLSAIIRDAVEQCVKDGSIDEKASRKYFWSVTEEEIFHGLLENPDTGAHCLCFTRELIDINLKHPKAWRFIEQNDDGTINQHTLTKLSELKDSVIEKLPQENVSRFTATWSENEGVNSETHKDYLLEFSQKFEKELIRLIHLAILQKKLPVFKGISVDTMDSVFTEVVAHAHTCVEKVQNFSGREQVLLAIKNYVSSSSTKPFVVYGESGSGRTSIMAMAATQVTKSLGPDTWVLFRVLGTTPASSSAHSLLTSLFHQITLLSKMHGIVPQLDETIPTDLQEMAALFQKLLVWLKTTPFKIVIILDSIGQLSPVNNTFNLRWLPCVLPTNVKLVMSIIPKVHQLLKKLQSPFFGLGEDQFVEVPGLSNQAADQVLTQWLKGRSRTLNAVQQSHLQKLFVKTGIQPLYLKLVLDEIVKWRSYDEDIKLESTIPDCVNALFKDLEKKHGKLIVEHAFGYLSLSWSGLSEREMEDLLSLDEVVLTDVFQYHIPPVRRLPSILWARIRSDISEYIIEREANGNQVMAWNYRQFEDAAKERYFMSNTGYHNPFFKAKVEVFVDYFTGVWANNIPKPFSWSVAQKKKLKLKTANGSMVRYVSQQPDILKNGNLSDFDSIIFNQRKIAELQYILRAHNSYKYGSKYMSTYVATSLGFLMGFLKHHSWSEVIAALTSMNQKQDVHWLYQETKEVALVQQTLAMCYTMCMGNLSMLGPCVLSHLLYFFKHLAGITKLVNEVDSLGLQFCALVPPHQQQKTPGGEMESGINNHQGPVNDITSTLHPGQKLSRQYPPAYISVSQKVVLTDEKSGEVIVDFSPDLPTDDCFQTVIYVSEKFIRADPEAVNVCVACLKKRPWIYILNIQLDDPSVLGILHMDELLNVSHNSIIASVVTLHFQQLIVSCDNHIVFFGNLTAGGEILRKFQYTSCVQTFLPFVNTGSSNKSEVSLMVVLEDKVIVTDSQETEHAKASINTENSDGILLTKIYGGSTSVLLVLNEETMLKMWFNSETILVRKYSLPNVRVHSMSFRVRRKLSMGEEELETVVCADHYLFIVVDNHEDSSCSNVVLEIKGQTYHKAFVRGPTSKDDYVLYAYTGGLVDIFKVKIDGLKYTTKLILSLKAHGSQITKIFFPPKYQYTDNFLTGSSDSSVKVWQLQKARAASIHMPSFSHTKTPIQSIATTDFYAITKMEEHHKLFALWDLVTGKIVEYFSNDKIAGRWIHVTKDQRQLLLVDAIDHKHCVSWELSTPSTPDDDEYMDAKLYPASTEDCIYNTADPLIVPGDSNKETWIVTRGENVSQWYCCDTDTQDVRTIHKDLSITGTIDGARIGKGVLVLLSKQVLCIAKKDSLDIEKMSISSVLQEKDSAIFLTSGGKSQVLLLTKSKLFMWNIQRKQIGNTLIYGMHLDQALNEDATVMDNLEGDSNGLIVSVDVQKEVMMLCVQNQVLLLGITSFTLLGFIPMPKGQKIQYGTVTPDGQYAVCCTDKRMIFMYRVSDLTIIAKYTMYTDITSLSVSKNSWFVVCGTIDCRLISLLIVDHKVAEHRARIDKARATNGNVPKSQIKALLELFNPHFYKEAQYNEEDWSKASSGILVECNGSKTSTLASYDVQNVENKRSHRIGFIHNTPEDIKAGLQKTTVHKEGDHNAYSNKEDTESDKVSSVDSEGVNHKGKQRRLSKFKGQHLTHSQSYFIKHGHKIFS